MRSKGLLRLPGLGFRLRGDLFSLFFHRVRLISEPFSAGKFPDHQRKNREYRRFRRLRSSLWAEKSAW